MSYITWAVVGVLLACAHPCDSQISCRQPVCPDNSVCQEDTSGLGYCICRDGYRLNATGHCVDIDECTWDVCKSLFTCTNLPGSYDCAPDACFHGYVRIETICTDIDECEFPVCGPNGNCTNYPGLYECQYYSGYPYRNTSFLVSCRQPECPDFSSCQEGTSGLGYCICSDGYRLNATGHCVDIDECTWDVCRSLYTCTNLPGSYDCAPDACFHGYVRIETICTDIDECEFPVCGLNGNCINYPGLYQCLCYSGYRFTDDLCFDVDECTERSPCHRNAACSNFPGTYSCVCDDGFFGNGTHCEDVDECLIPNSCDGTAACRNLPGTYSCVCNDGFSGDGTYCEDVDECTEQNPCDGNAACRNLPGAYDCGCIHGYSGNGTHCEVVDSEISPPLVAGVAGGCSLAVLTVILVAIFVIRRRMRQTNAPAANVNNQTMDTVISGPENLPEVPDAVSGNQPASVRGGGSTANLYHHLDSETPASDYTTVGGPQNMNPYDHLDEETPTSDYTTVGTPQNTNVYAHLEGETPTSDYTTVGSPQNTNLYDQLDGETSASDYTRLHGRTEKTHVSDGYCLPVV